QGIHRLELTVMTHNQRALALYRKMGFEIEGTLRHNMRVDGVYVDEYSLAQLLT
ncbi:MAG: GNAT family N-acetyltransferase, partial [Chloroflexi bacterium]|nr:GNAT family N-acetyltransferase [Chloroflexota bacterium]